MTVELLRKQPGAYEDMPLGEQMEESDVASESPEIPSWCKCKECIAMPTNTDKCSRSSICVTSSVAFRDICLNEHILEVNMREDEIAIEAVRTNTNYRYYSYRNYIYWKFGRLGRGNRAVLPACK